MRTKKMTTMTTPTAHHDFGPSRWPAFLSCGFYTADGKTSDVATIGTTCHDILAKLLHKVNADEPVSDAALEDVIKTIPKAELDALDDYNLANVYNTSALIEQKSAGHELHVEEAVHLPDGTFGTCDVWWSDGNSLHVADFKTFPIGDKDYFPQLQAYAIGILAERNPETAKPAFREQTIIFLHVLTPDGEQVRTCNLAQCEATQAKMKANIFDAEHGTGVPCPSSWCKYCANNGRCESQVFAAQKAANIAAANALTELSDSEVIDLAEKCEDFAEAVKAKAKERLRSGEEIPGWKLQKKAGAQRIEDMRKAWECLRHEGVTPAQFLAKVTISVRAAREALLEAGKTKEEAANALLAFTYRADDTYSLVRDNAAKKIK